MMIMILMIYGYRVGGNVVNLLGGMNVSRKVVRYVMKFIFVMNGSVVMW